MQGLVTIELKQLRFFSFHGLYEEEKKTGNDFEVELAITYKTHEVVIREITSTINYAVLFELVKTEMQKPRELLETLAMELAELVHAAFPQVIKAEISITKMNPPILSFTGRVGVTFTKEW